MCEDSVLSSSEKATKTLSSLSLILSMNLPFEDGIGQKPYGSHKHLVPTPNI